MAGKGDKFRWSINTDYDKSTYWCAVYSHKGYGKPKHKCRECKQAKENK